jgi:hypothetical protein
MLHSLSLNGRLSFVARFVLTSNASLSGLTGLTPFSTGLVISTAADNESVPVAYTAADGTIEEIAALGTYAAPTAGKCRFGEYDPVGHPGLYELQLSDARLAVAFAKGLTVSFSGAGVMTGQYGTFTVQLDAPVDLMKIDGEFNINATLELTQIAISNPAGSGIVIAAGVRGIDIQSDDVAVYAESASASAMGLIGRGGALSVVSMDGEPAIHAWGFFNTTAVLLEGTGTGSGLDIKGGITGAGVKLAGGVTSGSALVATTSNGDAVQFTAGGSGSDALQLVGAGGGYDLNLNGTGTTSGNLLSTTAVASIWNALTSGMSTASSVGKKLADWVIGTTQTADVAATFSRLGAPAGASISADIAAAKTVVDAINTKVGTPAGASLSADVAAVKTDTGNTYSRLGAPAGASISADIAGVQSDTNDLQTRLPAALGANGNLKADVRDWVGAAVATPATAGYPVVTHKVGTGTGEINLASGKVPATLASTDVTGNVAVDLQTIKTQAVTCAAGVTVGVNVGTSQPLNFTGTGGSATVKADLVNIAGAAVSTTTAQIGVNAVKLGNTVQTGRDIGASVLLSSGTGTGQVSVSSGVIASNLKQIDGVATLDGYPTLRLAQLELDNSGGGVGAPFSITMDSTYPAIQVESVGTGRGVNIQADGNHAVVFTSSTNDALRLSGVSGADLRLAGSASVVGNVLSSAAVASIWNYLTSAMSTVGSVGKKLADWTIGTTQTADVAATFARLGAPAGASIAADLAAVKSDTGSTATAVGTIGTTTTNTFSRLGAPVGASLSADIAGVQADTNDLQSRLPAALGANGNMKADIVDYNGVASASTGGRPDVNVVRWAGTVVAGTDTAGYPKVTLKSGTGAGEVALTAGKIGMTLSSADVTGNLPADVQTIKTQSVTCAAGVTVGAQVGGAQPLNFTGTGGSATLKTDLVNIAGAAVNTAAAQLGVNAVNIGGTAQTGRNLGASVLVSSGTGAGQIDLSGGVVKSNLTQIDGVATFDGFPTLQLARLIVDNSGEAGPAVQVSTDGAASAVSITQTGSGRAVNVTADANDGVKVTAASVGYGVTLHGSGAADLRLGSTGTVVGNFLSSTAIAAIWNALTSGMSTVGSLGKKLADWTIGTTQTADVANVYSRLGAPAGASVSADVAAIKAETALTYARVGAPAGASVAADLAAVKVVADATKLDTGYILEDTGDDGVVVAAGSKTGYSLTTAYDLYHAKVELVKDEANGADEYTIQWFKNGAPLGTGLVTSPTLAVVSRSGTTLVAEVVPTEIGATGAFKHDETTNRTTAGDSVLILVGGVVDGSVRSWRSQAGRDSIAA